MARVPLKLGNVFGDYFESLVDDLTERIGRLERANPQTFTVAGARTDLPAGTGPRVSVGLLSDGTYGIERWTEAGVRETPTWT